MDWLTVIWCMVASACLTLGLTYIVVWIQDRCSRVHLLFALAALGVAGVSIGELLMMLADTPEQFAARLRWVHVPLFITVVAMVWFVRLYFQAGRVWLGWSVCSLRGLALVLNFIVAPNLNYSEITGLRRVPVFANTTVAVADGNVSPRTRIGELSSLLLLVYVIDAAITVWRRGGQTQRRRAIVVGGTMVFFVLAGAGHVMLIHAGLLDWPYMISLAFLVPVAAMAYELGTDVARSGQLRRELELRQAELRENEQQMELAATAAGLGMWRWDIVANRIWVNDRGRPLLGLNGDDEFGLDHFLGKLVPQDRDPVHRAVMRSLDNGSDYESEYRIRLHDGSTRWIAARGRVECNGNARPVLMRGVAFDITERRNAEVEQGRQRDELAHLSRVTMLGELSGSLAHELNQPLAAILSNAQAAQEFLAAPNPDLDEVRDILQDIVNEDRRAGEVIRRLRLLFRKGELHHDPLDLNDLVLDVLKLMNSELVNSSVTVHISLAPALPYVRGDRVQVQQVLINLIVNASDAMAGIHTADRKLRITTACTDDDQVHLCVADTGCGIPVGKLDEVFEPFHTTKPTGMGLGLAVCRTIMSAHGGKLWASNNDDRGASFHMTLAPSGTGKP